MPRLRNTLQEPSCEWRALKSALGRQEYGLAAPMAHLVLLAAGGARLESPAVLPEFDGPRLLWLPPGIGGGLHLAAGARGQHLRLSAPALMRALPAGHMNQRLREVLRHPQLPPLDEPDLARIAGLMETIGAEGYTPAPGSEIVSNSLIAVILVRLWRLVQSSRDAAGVSVPRSIMERFLLLETQHRRAHWTVGDYARAIGISRERLASAVTRAAGLSPQQFLHRELMNEARGLLLHSGLQVTEIAYRLGFQDPAYFNRFFSRLEGMAPARFRRAARDRLPRETDSFAAWP